MSWRARATFLPTTSPAALALQMLVGPPFRGFSLAPDGKSFATSMFRASADIRMLEGFPPTAAPWLRLFQRPT